MGTLFVFWSRGSAGRPIDPGERFTIGRQGDFCVEDRSVSRQHAEIDVSAERVTIRDLGSHNGTNCGSLVIGSEPVTLRPGEPVDIGSATLFWRPAAPPKVVDASPPASGGTLERVHRLADLVARGTIGVLIIGETGAGKEVLAQRVHERSPRASGLFLRVNCAALPESLLEAELFGFEKGAFTGAIATKPGLLEAAHGGSVLLDEIGELPPGTQAKLLRVLEAHETTRLGSIKARKIDVRFIAATNRDLPAMVRSGGFRADLYYRLNGVTLTVPPLRARPDEIHALAESFVASAARRLGREPPRVSAKAMDVLLRYEWPGNVRELRNVIDCALLTCGSGDVDVEHLTIAAQEVAPTSGVSPRAPEASLRDELASLERQRIEDALGRSNGNQTRAAEMLGISRRALIARIETWGLPRPRKR